MIDAIKQKKFLIFLFFASLFIRVVFFNIFLRNNPVQLSYDSGHYHAMATALVHDKGFSHVDGAPAFYRLPGYPLFLTACYELFNENVTKTMFMQIVLASIIPLLVFVLAILCFPSIPIIAYGSSIITMLHPGFIIFSGLVMSETLFVILFLLFVILFLLALYRRRLWYMFFSGALLGAASLVRPVGLFVVILVGLFSLFLFSKKFKNGLKQTCFFVTGWLVIAGIWLARNYVLTGMLFFDTLSGPHFLNHGAVRVAMMVRHSSYEQARVSVYGVLGNRQKQEEQRLHRPLNEIEVSRIAQQCALSVMMQHPLVTAKLCALNMFKTMFSLYSSELLCIDSGGRLPPYDMQRGLKDMIMRFVNPSVHNPWIVLVIYWELFLHSLIMLGSFGMLLFLFRRRFKNSVAHGIILILVMLFLILSCVCGFARLRLPIEPFFIMLSMEFWNYILTRKRV